MVSYYSVPVGPSTPPLADMVEAVSMAEKLQKQSVMRRGHEDLGRHGRRLRSREEPGGMAEVEEEERGSVGPLLWPC